MAKMEELKVHGLQLILQGGYAGLAIITRAASLKGMNIFVFVFYRNLAAFIVLAPLSYFLDRNMRPKMTWTAAFHILLLGFGIAASQNLYFQGLYYTSSTLGAAATTVIPVCTLLIGIILRQEKINWKSSRGQAKVGGTMLSMCGTLVMSLYKGPSIKFLRRHQPSKVFAAATTVATTPMWLGSVLLFGGTLTWAITIVLQGVALKSYPVQLSLTLLISIVSALVSALAALIFEPGKSSIWVLRWNIQLFSILYAGLVCSSIGLLIQGWTVTRKGPLFIAVYAPVCLLITSILDYIVFDDVPTLGSVLGALLIVVGLYSALWGKFQEQKISNKNISARTMILIGYGNNENSMEH